MKNFSYLIILLSVVFVMQSCKKDQEFTMDPIENGKPTLLKKRTCDMEAHMHNLMLDPSYKKKHDLKFRKLEQLNGRKVDMKSNTVLPIAVHFQDVSDPDIACLRTLAQAQVDILNNDYRGSNSDLTSWSNGAASSFPGIKNGAAAFRFCLANKNHPPGYNLSDGDLAVTVNATTGDFDAKWSGYINIFVQYNTGVLGYSPLGGVGNGDGVVIDASAFGSGSGCGTIKPNAPYNLGRTLTHELGHYLLLDHIWGDGCGTDDLVPDTPESSEPYYDCPNIGESTCGSTDMHMNYMDYTNDACMYMFSEGQVTRSTNYVATSLSAVIDNAANVCGDVDGGGDNGGGDNGGGDNGGGDNGGDDNGPTTGCIAPTTFDFGTIDASSAQITWNAVAEATGYRIQFKSTGQEGWYSASSSTNSFDLVFLAPETDYEFRIKTLCGDDGAPWSSIQRFRTGNHGCHESGTCADTPIFLEIGLDDYGSETSWDIQDAAGNIVADGSGYEDGQNGTTIEQELCLQDGCYTFTIYDAFGDGICCDFGDGYFQLLNVDGSVLFSGDGSYGSFSSVELCINTSNKEGKRAKRGSTKIGKRDPAVIARSRATKN